MPLGLLLTHAPQIPPCFNTELQFDNYTDLTGRLNVTTAVALANTQRPPTCHVSSIAPLHQLHSALIFDKQNCNSLLMFVGCLSFFFCFKRKKKETCETLWKSRDVLFFALQTLTSLLYFFLLEKSSWLLYIVMMLMMTMITYLLAVQGALLPACVCMKGVMIVWPNGHDVTKMRMISGASVLLLQCWMFFLSFFLCPWEIHENHWCALVCVCVVWLLLNTYLLQSGKWIDVNLTACIWERIWMCGCDVCACLTVW